MVGISERIPDCEPELDEEGNPELDEPHVHGVQVDRKTGTVYVSDEGEHCFYESVTILMPDKDDEEGEDDENGEEDERD